MQRFYCIVRKTPEILQSFPKNRQSAKKIIIRIGSKYISNLRNQYSLLPKKYKIYYISGHITNAPNYIN